MGDTNPFFLLVYLYVLVIGLISPFRCVINIAYGRGQFKTKCKRSTK